MRPPLFLRKRSRDGKKEDVEAFKNLSEEQKDKFKTFIEARMKETPVMTREKRGKIIRAAMKK